MTGEQVLSYLRGHPSFLLEHPELLSTLVPPARQIGDGVVDMQKYMVERVQAQLHDVEDQYAGLIATTRDNLTSQARVHNAILALLAATTFEHLIETVTTDLAIHLDVDVATLCVEVQADESLRPSRAGVRILAAGAVDDLLGPGRNAMLRADMKGTREVFGAGAGLVRSAALLRMKISPAAPVGLLALGSRVNGRFHSKQGTELLGFLARVVERSIRSWLDLPA